MKTKKTKEEPSIFTADEFQAMQKTRKKSSQKEAKIQVQVCDYIKKNYPDVIFQCDLASGMNLGKFIGGMNTRLRSSRGMPDLFIAKPVKKYSEPIIPSSGRVYTYFTEFNGLFIELKQESVRLKSGGIAKSPHHDEQAEVLARLKQLGYRAEFCCGLNEAIKLIDEYLSN